MRTSKIVDVGLSRVSVCRALVMMVTLSLALPAWGQVHDNAGLLSDAAKRTALQNIDQMKSRFAHTMLIETYASVPTDQRAALDQNKNAFFERWAVERGKAEGVTGVVLLICMDPKHYEIVVGNKTKQSGTFTEADRTDVGARVREALAAGRYDDAVTVGTAEVLERITANRSSARGGSSDVEKSNGGATNSPPVFSTPSTTTPRTAPPSRGIGSWLCLGIAALGIFMIVRRIFAGRRSGNAGMTGGPGGVGPFNPNGPGYGQQGPGYGQQGPGYGGGGGGGFGRGALGGLLGGVAGGWLGNKVFGQGQQPHDPSAGGSIFGNQPPSNPDVNAPDTDFSGGGGDFGSSDAGGGGGDSGGSGGGDF